MFSAAGLYDYLGKHPQAAAIFDAAITDRARQENDAVVEAYDWASDMIVDVGGGQGSLLAAILHKARSARGMLFEAPHVADGAKTIIEQAGLARRCAVVGGDFFQSVPTGGDLYLMRRITARLERRRRRQSSCATAARPWGRMPGFSSSSMFLLREMRRPGERCWICNSSS